MPTSAQYAGTAADNNAIGTLTWSTATNAQGAPDALFATVTGASSAVTHYLKVTNYSLAVTTGATINGVTAVVTWKRGSGATVSMTDTTVKLVKGGVVSGNNKNTNTAAPASSGTITYGSGSDLWGVTLTDTDVNASTFGVVLSYTASSSARSTSGVAVDSVQITVAYTNPGGEEELIGSCRVMCS